MVNRIVFFVVEVLWVMGWWEILEKYFGFYNVGDVLEVFDFGVG